MADQQPILSDSQAKPSRFRTFLLDYVWFILKNILGWLLIVLAFPLGALIPGPGGIPLFLIGFALITFPGKRRLTARVLRGRRFRLYQRRVVGTVIALALIAPVGLVWYLNGQGRLLERMQAYGPLVAAGLYLGGVVAAAVLFWGLLLAFNWALRFMPPIRRKVRPWLRNHHIRLLPPRRRRRLPHEHGTGPLAVTEEILCIQRPACQPTENLKPEARIPNQ